nr:MAG TPA: hypothetical protein [Caudoviricetes sp.]
MYIMRILKSVFTWNLTSNSFQKNQNLSIEKKLR